MLFRRAVSTVARTSQRRLMASTPAHSGESAVADSVYSFDIAKPQSWPSVKESMLPENFHAREHAKGSTKWWLGFNIVFTVPVLAAIGYICVPKELAHMKHLHEHPNEYVAFPHLRKRKNDGHVIRSLTTLD
ncbi:hypothetical protein HDU96_006596 [Phlyctochytrium bullatum]|nr:hypothetical protein HDU96_006596 [Phlyctochytrium bullatum]